MNICGAQIPDTPTAPPSSVEQLRGGAAAQGGGLAVIGTGLSLLRTCSNGQVLQYNGTVWACAVNRGGVSVDVRNYPGATADLVLNNACAAAIAQGGGLVDTRGWAGQTETLANYVSGCTSDTATIMLVVDPSTRWTTTQTDGGCTFKWGNGSGAWAPGVGQQIGGGPPYGGFNVAASAKVTAIMCPAHTDGTQETMFISGLHSTASPGPRFQKD